MPRPEVFNRIDVLNNAKQVFWLKGYNGTSMQDLVDATGLNRSSIYNSFGSKMELYREVLSHYQKESVTLFDVASECSGTPFEMLQKIFQLQLEDILQDTDKKGCMAINCGTEMGNQNKGLGQWVSGNQEMVIAKFKELVEAAQESGEIDTKRTSEDLANYLVASFQGLRITGAYLQDKNALQQIINNILFTLK